MKVPDYIKIPSYILLVALVLLPISLYAAPQIKISKKIIGTREGKALCGEQINNNLITPTAYRSLTRNYGLTFTGTDKYTLTKAKAPKLIDTLRKSVLKLKLKSKQEKKEGATLLTILHKYKRNFPAFNKLVKSAFLELAQCQQNICRSNNTSCTPILLTSPINGQSYYPGETLVVAAETIFSSTPYSISVTTNGANIPLISGTTDSNGKIGTALILPLTLEIGSYILVVSVNDRSVSVEITVQALGAGNETSLTILSPYPNQQVSAQQGFVINVSTDPGSSIRLLLDGDTLAIVTADAQGSASFSLNSGLNLLAPGQHIIGATFAQGGTPTVSVPIEILPTSAAPPANGDILQTLSLRPLSSGATIVGATESMLAYFEIGAVGANQSITVVKENGQPIEYAYKPWQTHSNGSLRAAKIYLRDPSLLGVNTIQIRKVSAPTPIFASGPSIEALLLTPFELKLELAGNYKIDASPTGTITFNESLSFRTLAGAGACAVLENNFINTTYGCKASKSNNYALTPFKAVDVALYLTRYNRDGSWRAYIRVFHANWAAIASQLVITRYAVLAGASNNMQLLEEKTFPPDGRHLQFATGPAQAYYFNGNGDQAISSDAKNSIDNVWLGRDLVGDRASQTLSLSWPYQFDFTPGSTKLFNTDYLNNLYNTHYLNINRSWWDTGFAGQSGATTGAGYSAQSVTHGVGSGLDNAYLASNQHPWLKKIVVTQGLASMSTPSALFTSSTNVPLTRAGLQSNQIAAPLFAWASQLGFPNILGTYFRSQYRLNDLRSQYAGAQRTGSNFSADINVVQPVPGTASVPTSTYSSTLGRTSDATHIHSLGLSLCLLQGIQFFCDQTVYQTFFFPTFISPGNRGDSGRGEAWQDASNQLTAGGSVAPRFYRLLEVIVRLAFSLEDSHPAKNELMYKIFLVYCTAMGRYEDQYFSLLPQQFLSDPVCSAMRAAGDTTKQFGSRLPTLLGRFSPILGVLSGDAAYIVPTTNPNYNSPTFNNLQSTENGGGVAAESAFMVGLYMSGLASMFKLTGLGQELINISSALPKFLLQLNAHSTNLAKGGLTCYRLPTEVTNNGVAYHVQTGLDFWNALHPTAQSLINGLQTECGSWRWYQIMLKMIFPDLLQHATNLTIAEKIAIKSLSDLGTNTELANFGNTTTTQDKSVLMAFGTVHPGDLPYR